MRRFASWYGAHPLHLVVLLASFALAGYAAVRFVPDNPVGIALWFVGAAVSHDLLLFPLYSVVGVALVRGWRRGAALPVVPWVNYVRVPALLSGLLLLVWFPLIFQLPAGYSNTTALSTEHYLEHWLAITAALFLISAILFAVRLRREHAARRTPADPPDPS